MYNVPYHCHSSVVITLMLYAELDKRVIRAVIAAQRLRCVLLSSLQIGDEDDAGMSTPPPVERGSGVAPVTASLPPNPATGLHGTVVALLQSKMNTSNGSSIT